MGELVALESVAREHMGGAPGTGKWASETQPPREGAASGASGFDSSDAAPSSRDASTEPVAAKARRQSDAAAADALLFGGTAAAPPAVRTAAAAAAAATRASAYAPGGLAACVWRHVCGSTCVCFCAPATSATSVTPGRCAPGRCLGVFRGLLAPLQGFPRFGARRQGAGPGASGTRSGLEEGGRRWRQMVLSI